MRASFYFLILFWASIVHADVDIKTTIKNDKTVYLLQVGAFPHQKNAEELQKNLTESLKQPVLIYRPDIKSPYIVQVGPIEELALARELKTKIEQMTANPAPDTPASFNPPDAPLLVDKPAEKIWNLRNADIRAVIAEVSRVTGKNFLIDPRVQGKISIVSSTPMSDKELYQVFLSMLQISGYAAIPSGEVIKIIPNIDAKTLSPDLLSSLKSPPHGDDMMVEVIPVHYVPAEQLVPVLRPLMPQWSSVSAYAPSNMLILSGRAGNIRQMASIIKQVDSSSSSGIDMVPLRHALAMDIANTLKDLVKAQPSSPLHGQTTLAADDRNNAILISGSKTDRIRLRLLISQLDRSGPYGSNSNTQVVYLNYLRAEDLVPILAGIAQASFSGTVGTTIGTITRPALDSTNPAASLATGSSSGGQTMPPASVSATTVNPAATPNTTGAATQVEGSTKPTVQIIAEPNTNSVIINAPVTLIRTLKSVISQLDIKPAQILIEALVAEINESDVNDLGIEWGSIDQDTLSSTTFRPGFAIINSRTSLDQFQAQIYALARQRKANILSTPSVVVLDNRQAKILIGKQVSVASTTYPNNAGGTTTASPFTTFDRVNVALHLYVRPQITRGKGIQMQIDQGNDTLDPASTLDPTTNPVFNISAIVTSVHVESGDIIVLGGLKQDSLGNDDNRLPIVGDLPGFGRLFQRNITNREKKVLMVFIRPLILKTELDALRVTGGKYTDVRQYQLQSLREEDYDPRNDEIVLPPLTQAPLPKPFCRPAAPMLPPKAPPPSIPSFTVTK
ncbi:GspD family T2SS secretin variant LspD [Legionella sp. 27cVA30]|uniref:GspD family T2SS secretin variant LspD n=1 Tax=Legionella TaxID=445 RepID=UPI000F8E10F8|nr:MULTISPECIES: GspD family T2SS secretin variant LspD [Legionella]MCP0913619.1 GspD family T2SS secretin variant LspD [Legionella sp. 27cVA30]RUR12701.1 type II secretion system protein GspD [Legionella septentrionalis]